MNIFCPLSFISTLVLSLQLNQKKYSLGKNNPDEPNDHKKYYYLQE